MNQQTLVEPAQWVDEHGDALYRYAMARLRNPELAEDMVQETFVAALKARDSFEGRSSARTWLVGILKRKIIDHYRRRYREQPVSELSSSDEADRRYEAMFNRFSHWSSQGPRLWENPQAALEEEEFFRVLQGCLDKLPGRLADAFVLREMEQMSSEEVRQVLGISSSNLWAMLHRARYRLRACLEINWFDKKTKGKDAC